MTQIICSYPELILHFDINKTLIASDSVKGESIEYGLLSTVAEKSIGVWAEGQPPQSYKDYVYNVLLPGDKNDQALKALRHEKILGFLNLLKETNHPAHNKAFDLYNRLLNKSVVSGNGVFPSFYKLIEKLKKANIHFVVLLRTYGKNLDDVAEEIGKHPDGITFKRFGKFSEKKLLLDGEDPISRVDLIFNTVLHSKEHFALQDNWSEWNSDGGLARSSKPFIFDASGKMHDVQNLSLFFDDNFTAGEKDILNPMEVYGKCVSGKDIENKLAFTVDMVEALLDDSYYIKLVNHALVQAGFPDI